MIKSISTGSSGLIWSILCLCLVSNSPSQQRWISREEAEYIKFSLAGDLQSQVKNKMFVNFAIKWRECEEIKAMFRGLFTHFIHFLVIQNS